MAHIDVPPGRAAQSLWCDRNWHDGTCCPGSIRQWHQDHDLLPPEPDDDPCPRCGGDHDRIDRREPCPEPEPTEHEGHAVVEHSTAAYCATCDAYWTLPRPEWLGTQR
jgi:hypothetical protein